MKLSSVVAVGFRTAFFALAAGVLFAALSASHDMSGTSDKLVHFTVFYFLTLSAMAAWPRLGGLCLAAVSLILFGAAIEQLQFYVGRDRELMDWVADTAGVFAAVLPVLVWRVSDQLRKARG